MVAEMKSKGETDPVSAAMATQYSRAHVEPLAAERTEAIQRCVAAVEGDERVRGRVRCGAAAQSPSTLLQCNMSFFARGQPGQRPSPPPSPSK